MIAAPLSLSEVEPTMRNNSGRTEAAMPFILLTVLIDLLAIGLIVPVIPALVGTFSSSQADQAYWYGRISFAFGFA